MQTQTLADLTLVPDEPDFGTDEQLDHDFEQWATNYDHAYVMTYEDPQYF